MNAANGGRATKTKLMYSAFIFFNQLREYLSLLVENGLIQYEEGTHTYRTTEKGIRFLHLQSKIDEELRLFIPARNKAKIKLS